MNTGPDKRDDGLETWLDQLGGRSSGDDPVADRLRKLISEDQQKAEAEIDELRLRRGRDRLLDAARESAGTPSSTRARPLALAASVMLMLVAGFFAYQFSATPDAELIMSYGDIERFRGNVPTLAVDVEDPVATAMAAGERLRGAGIPFEIWQTGDDQVSLHLTARDVADIQRLKELFGESGPDIPEPGYYVIVYD